MERYALGEVEMQSADMIWEKEPSKQAGWSIIRPFYRSCCK